MDFKRFPHLFGPGRLDLLRSLPPGEAREAERLLEQEHRSDQRAARSTSLSGVANMADAMRARAYTTGGGRRRPTEPVS